MMSEPEMKPRSEEGAISDSNAGTAFSTKPTPRYATTRPALKAIQFLAVISTVHQSPSTVQEERHEGYAPTTPMTCRMMTRTMTYL